MKSYIHALTFFFILAHQGFSQCFTPIGPIETEVYTGPVSDNEFDMALAPNGDIYVAFDQKFGSDDKLSVLRYHGSTREFVGPQGFSSTGILKVDMCINSIGKIYVAYQSSNMGLRTFDGTNWVNPPGFTTAGSFSDPVLDTDTLGNIYLASTNYSSQINIVKYDGATTTTFVTPLMVDVETVFDFDLSNTGIPYLAYRNDVTNKLCVKKYTGSWIDVGPPDFSGSSVTEINIKTDSSGTPYVIYRDALFSGKAQVKKFDGTSWVSVGPSSISGGPIEDCEIVFSPTNKLYVVYADFQYSSQGESIIKEFDGTAWMGVGITDSTMFAIGPHPKIVFKNDTIYAGCLEDAAMPQVERFQNPYWEEFLPTGINTNNLNSPQMLYDKINNIVYVAFADEKLRNRTTVLKYQAGVWDTVGRIGFTKAPALNSTLYNLMALDTNNFLYIAYKDPLNNRASVKKFNGSSWVYVGSPGFSTTILGLDDFKIDQRTNIPYVAYAHYGSGDDANVEYYNGTSWVNLGAADFTPNVYSMHIAIDTLGVVYAVFKDGTVSNKESCMKFDGTTWAYTGPVGFTAGQIETKDLIIDKATNMPMFAFHASTSSLGNVYIFNGSTWNNYGPANFSTDGAAYMDFCGNILYLVTDHHLYFNVAGGAAWTPFGEFPSQVMDFGVDETGQIYVTHFTDGYIFLKEFHYESIPEVLSDPAPVIACPFSNASFGMEAFGLSNSFQWQVNTGSGFVNLTDDAVYAGSNTDTLVITNAPPGFNGNIYQCIVNSFCGADTTVTVSIDVSGADASFSGLDTTACMSNGTLTLVSTETGGVFSGPGISGSTFDPVTAGAGYHTITYLVTDGIGCTDSSSATVHVFPITDASFSDLDSAYCDFDSTILLIPVNPGGAFTGSGVVGNVFYVGSTGVLGPVNISYTLTDANGCTSTSMQTVIMNHAVDINLPPVINYCGYNLDLNGGGTTGETSSYIWNTGDTTQYIDVTTDGVYAVQVTHPTGCVTYDTTTVFMHPLPLVTFNLSVVTYCADDLPFALTTGTPSGGIYSGPGVTGSVFDPGDAGPGITTISYLYTDGFGCSGSATEDVYVNTCVGMDEKNMLKVFLMYPNPANEQLNIISLNKTPYSILLYDPAGKLVYSSAGLQANYLLDTQQLPAGLYNICIQTADICQHTRLVVYH